MSVRSPRLRPLILPLLLVVAWAAAVWATRSAIFPTPGQVALGIVELTRSGVLVQHVAASLFRVTYGYFLAALLAIPLGVWIGMRPAAYGMFNPVVQLLRPISPIAWIPLAILWFGVGDLSPIFLIFLSSFFPMVVATAAGVRAIEQRYLRAARNFGLKGMRLVLRIIVPAALPQIVTGLRIGLGVAWLVVVAAEMIAVNSGLGYQIIDARNTGTRYDLVVAGMVVTMTDSTRQVRFSLVPTRRTASPSGARVGISTRARSTSVGDSTSWSSRHRHWGGSGSSGDCRVSRSG